MSAVEGTRVAPHSIKRLTVNVEFMSAGLCCTAFGVVFLLPCFHHPAFFPLPTGVSKTFPSGPSVCTNRILGTETLELRGVRI